MADESPFGDICKAAQRKGFALLADEGQWHAYYDDYLNRGYFQNRIAGYVHYSRDMRSWTGYSRVPTAAAAAARTGISSNRERIVALRPDGTQHAAADMRTIVPRSDVLLVLKKCENQNDTAINSQLAMALRQARRERQLLGSMSQPAGPAPTCRLRYKAKASVVDFWGLSPRSSRVATWLAAVAPGSEINTQYLQKNQQIKNECGHIAFESAVRNLESGDFMTVTHTRDTHWQRNNYSVNKSPTIMHDLDARELEKLIELAYPRRDNTNGTLDKTDGTRVPVRVRAFNGAVEEIKMTLMQAETFGGCLGHEVLFVAKEVLRSHSLRH